MGGDQQRRRALLLSRPRRGEQLMGPAGVLAGGIIFLRRSRRCLGASDAWVRFDSC